MKTSAHQPIAAALLGLMMICPLGGCVLDRLGSTAKRNGPPKADAHSGETQRVENPQATMIRFEGDEWVLGNGQCRLLPGELLGKQLRELLEKDYQASAQHLIALHRRSTHGWLMDRWQGGPDEASLFAADTLDGLRYAGPGAPYRALLQIGQQRTAEAERFQELRSRVAEQVAGGELAVDELLRLADQLGSPLLIVESRRLRGLGRMSLLQTALAQEDLNAAMSAAEQCGSPALLSECALLASQAALQTEDIGLSAESWRVAVQSQLSAMTTGALPSDQTHGGADLPDLNAAFWEQASRLKPANQPWPREVALAVAPWSQRWGIDLKPEHDVDMLLWAAIAQHQLVAGQPELAVVSLKKAELDARPSVKPWLRIAQARALAAQGQTTVATTVLGEPSGAEDPKLRAAAGALMGSIKIAHGAPAQGAQILQKVLSEHAEVDFPGRLDAEADLANATLILGSTDEALPKLHAIQQRLLAAGRWQAAIVALENEAAILELEGRSDAAADIRRRVLELQQI